MKFRQLAGNLFSRKNGTRGMYQSGRDEGRGELMDWMIKGRLLIMGSVLVVLGPIIYVVKNNAAVFVLDAVGAVLLIAGVLYRPRPKKTDPVTEDSD